MTRGQMVQRVIGEWTLVAVLLVAFVVIVLCAPLLYIWQALQRGQEG